MKIIITEKQKRTILDSLVGEKVMVYYNLNKQTFSVLRHGTLVFHADYVKLSDVEFRVRQGGKERVRKEKTKNVHAFVIGTLKDFCKYPCDEALVEPDSPIVTYNPYKYDSFVYKETGEPVHKAEEVQLVNLSNKLFVIKEDELSDLLKTLLGGKFSKSDVESKTQSLLSPKKEEEKIQKNIKGLIFQNNNPSSNNWAIVFGGTPSSKYGAKFMQSKASELSNLNVVFSNWENEIDFVESTLKSEFPKAKVKSVSGFSKGGLRAYPASGKYEFVGLIDPSIEGNYKSVNPSGTNTYMSWYPKRKWGIKSLKYAMDKLGPNNVIPINVGHLNQPEEFFSKFKNKM